VTRKVWWAAAALLVLAGISGAALTLGRGGEAAWPSARNPRPTGLAAFADLLRQDGITVVVSREARPELGPRDLAVAVHWVQDSFWSRVESQREEIDRSSGETPPERPVDRTHVALATHLAEGGRLLRLCFPAQLADDDYLDTPQTEASWTEGGEPMLLTYDPGRAVSLPPDTDLAIHSATLRGMAGDIVRLGTVGSGLRADVTDALGATNRYIGRGDNAKFYLGLVRKLREDGGRVVFVEATFGNVESKGVLGTLGGWAVAAQWQAVLAFLVALFVFGARFGLPTTESVASRGARDMLDAVAGILRRSRRPGFAAALVARSVLEEARQRMGMSPGASDDEIMARFDPDLSAAVWDALQDEDGRDVARSVELARAMLAAADRSGFARK
jgi:hypothetical protein